MHRWKMHVFIWWEDEIIFYPRIGLGKNNCGVIEDIDVGMEGTIESTLDRSGPASITTS